MVLLEHISGATAYWNWKHKNCSYMGLINKNELIKMVVRMIHLKEKEVAFDN